MKTDWRPLAGKNVWLLPDTDQPGRKYAETVAGIVAKLTPTPVVRVVASPGLPEGGDIVDWIDAHGDAAELDGMRAEIDALARATAPWRPAIAVVENRPRCVPVLVCMADVEPQAVPWLWPGRIPLGRISLLVGRPGAGNSFLTVNLAAHVSRAAHWPDIGFDSAPLGDTLLICAEDDAGDTIRPRLNAVGADCQRVHLLEAVKIIDLNEKETSVAFDLSNVELIRDALNLLPACRLVIIDPIGSLRCPSEVLSLEWWHVEAKATRPTGWKSCNLRTTFGKLIKRAGLEPWPRLFHNSGRKRRRSGKLCHSVRFAAR